MKTRSALSRPPGTCSESSRAGQIRGYHRGLASISVVGTGLILPLDVEPYGPGESEYAPGQRLLHRTVRQVGTRFADDVVVDAEHARAGFLSGLLLPVPVWRRSK